MIFKLGYLEVISNYLIYNLKLLQLYLNLVFVLFYLKFLVVNLFSIYFSSLKWLMNDNEYINNIIWNENNISYADFGNNSKLVEHKFPWLMYFIIFFFSVLNLRLLNVNLLLTIYSYIYYIIIRILFFISYIIIIYYCYSRTNVKSVQHKFSNNCNLCFFFL